MAAIHARFGAALRPAAASTRLLSSASASSQTASAAATGSAKIGLDQVRCIACGQMGHTARECTNVSAEQKAKNAQEYFRDGKCLICGEVGHQAKACPTLGLNATENAKPIEPKHERQPLEVRNAEKLCFQCGQKGHIMRDCPLDPYTKQIKRIEKRYSGSRLQKMLPVLLKEEKELRPVTEVMSKARPKLGVVVATNANKTISVLVPRTVLHPLFKIPLDRSLKFLVHDETEKAVCGDVVAIQQVRPISKRKHFALKDVVLSMNDRRSAQVERMAEARKLFDGLDETILKELEEKRKAFDERYKLRTADEKEMMQNERQKINLDVSQRTRELQAIINDAEAEYDWRNDEWLKEMQKTIDRTDSEARKILVSGFALSKEWDVPINKQVAQKFLSAMTKDSMLPSESEPVDKDTTLSLLMEAMHQTMSSEIEAWKVKLNTALEQMEKSGNVSKVVITTRKAQVASMLASLEKSSSEKDRSKSEDENGLIPVDRLKQRVEDMKSIVDQSSSEWSNVVSRLSKLVQLLRKRDKMEGDEKGLAELKEKIAAAFVDAVDRYHNVVDGKSSKNDATKKDS